MKQHIFIENLTGDAVTYPVDTSEEVDFAFRAMRAAGIHQTIIWNGEPGCPDVHSSGTVLCTDEGA